MCTNQFVCADRSCGLIQSFPNAQRVSAGWFSAGATGATGAAGAKGAAGSAGAKGAVGANGAVGATGA